MNYEEYFYDGSAPTYHGTLGEIRPGANRWLHLAHELVLSYGLVRHMPLAVTPHRRRILHLSDVNELAWEIEQALLGAGYEYFFTSFNASQENPLSIEMRVDFPGQGGLKEFRRLLEQVQPGLVLARCFPMHGASMQEYALTAQLAGVRLVYWLTEQGPEFSKHEVWAMEAPYLVCATRQDFEHYRTRRGRVFYAPFSCLPAFHYSGVPDPVYACDALAMGQPFADAARYPAFESRRESIRGLVLPLLEFCKVHVWGGWGEQVDGWRMILPSAVYDVAYRGILPYQDFSKALSSCKIVLGIHSNAPWGGYGGRLAKFLGCGAFVLWWYSQGMEKEFENRKHLVWVNSAEDAMREARYYLAHEEERHAIAAEGQRHAYAHLDYRTTLVPVLEQIEDNDRP